MTEEQLKMSVTRVKATGIILEHELSTDEVYDLLQKYTKKIKELKETNELLEKGVLDLEKLVGEEKDNVKKCNKHCQKLGKENKQLKSKLENGLCHMCGASLKRGGIDIPKGDII